jgi:hypothetical protein
MRWTGDGDKEGKRTTERVHGNSQESKSEEYQW